MKYGILLAAFGALGRQSQAALKLVEDGARKRFGGVGVRWAFTSPLMRERLAVVRQKTDSTQKALQKMSFEKFTHVAVQPLHFIPGAEYTEICREAASMLQDGHFEKITVGKPILAEDSHIQAAARALMAHLPEGRKPGEAVVFMGHGAKHSAVSRYESLAEAASALDPLVFVGTMNGRNNLEAVIAGLSASGVKAAWLLPLLSVVGRHALHDMAGSGGASWKTRIEEAGFECYAVLKGMAECSSFVGLWLDNLEAAFSSLSISEL